VVADVVTESMRTRGQSEDGGGPSDSGKELTLSLTVLLMSLILVAIFVAFTSRRCIAHLDFEWDSVMSDIK
jgi:hypothetical protein